MDTNVLVAAFRSDMGASFKLLSLVGDPRWELNVSTPLSVLDARDYHEMKARGVKFHGEPRQES